MTLHHGLTDLRNNYFTDCYILPWFQTPYQASLRFCLWAKLTSKQTPKRRKYEWKEDLAAQNTPKWCAHNTVCPPCTVVLPANHPAS